jgi:hypothetical protein
MKFYHLTDHRIILIITAYKGLLYWHRFEAFKITDTLNLEAEGIPPKRVLLLY